MLKKCILMSLRVNFALCLIFGFQFINCSDNETAKKEIKSSRSLEVIHALQKKWRANSNWTHSVHSKGLDRGVYTVEIDDAIRQISQQPQLLIAQLYDIRKKDSSFTAHFTPYSDNSLGSSFWYALRCNTDQKNRLMDTAVVGVDNGFVVVASFSNYKRPVMDIDASIIEAPTEDSEGKTKIYFYDPNDFIIYGELLDFAPLRDIGEIKFLGDSIYGTP